jgi:hypothetical protein
MFTSADSERKRLGFYRRVEGNRERMSEFEIGANRHIWESRYAALEEELRTDPVEPLAEFVALVEEMLGAAGYRTSLDEGAVGEPETVAALDRARELVALRDAGNEVRHDDAQQAAAELRELYRGLLVHSEADARVAQE